MRKELLQRYQELISRRAGLLIRDEDSELFSRTITARTKSLGLSSSEEYLRFLSADAPKSRLEWLELISILTTSETYFFRDKGQFALLQNWILPELIERNTARRMLSIWSAGCSTGEEPYSIAILIDEIRNTKYEFRNWNILILGSDINPKAIEKAERGVYSDWSFRMVDPEIRKRYFKKVADGWMLDERIRNIVKFRQGNLIEDTFPDYTSEVHDIDLIICRNVFIYFNTEAVSVIIRKFTDTLNEGGYLMTGHGELYGQSLDRLQARMFPESVIYQKASPELGVRSFEVRKPEKPEKPKIEIQKTIIEIPGIPTPDSQLRTPVSQLLTPSSELKTLLDAAESCANTGEYEKAESLCKMAIELDATIVKPYFLLAHIVEAKGDIKEAKALLKKAIYLEPAFIAAYLELGAIYDNEGDKERAKKMRTTAIELLNALPPDTAIEPYNGITVKELLEYVKKML